MININALIFFFVHKWQLLQYEKVYSFLRGSPWSVAKCWYGSSVNENSGEDTSPPSSAPLGSSHLHSPKPPSSQWEVEGTEKKACQAGAIRLLRKSHWCNHTILLLASHYPEVIPSPHLAAREVWKHAVYLGQSYTLLTGFPTREEQEMGYGVN